MTNKNTKIEPLPGYVFMKLEQEKKTKSGIIISDVGKSKPMTAKVVAVGEKVDIKSILRPGDRVAVDPFLLQLIKIDGEEFWVCEERDIFAKIKQ